MASENMRTVPISALNPYMNNWTIKARLLVKSEIIKWTNTRGSGSLFKMTFKDAAGDEIEAVAFKDEAKKFEPMVKEGIVYYISRGNIKMANKQYSTTKCDYQITLNHDSRIDVANDQESIGGASFDFVKINTLEQTKEGAIIDVVAIVYTIGDAWDIKSKKGQMLTKRDMILIDDTGADVRLTLWGDKAKADHVNWKSQPVVVLKGVKVIEYEGRQLSILQSTRITYDPPDVPEAVALKIWWANSGQEAAAQSLSRSDGSLAVGVTFEPSHPEKRMTFKQIKNDPCLGHGDKPYIVEFKAYITRIPTNHIWYDACTTCNKKAVANADKTSYHCEKCKKDFPHCDRRYMTSLNLTDATGDFWFSCFNDQCITLFDGHTATELATIAHKDTNKLDEFLKQYYFTPFHFKARFKTEQYEGKTRVKATITHIARVNFAKESKLLIDALKLSK